MTTPDGRSGQPELPPPGPDSVPPGPLGAPPTGYAPPPGPEGFYPTPGQPGYAPPPRKSSRGAWIRLAVVGLIALVIVVALVVLRDRFSGDVTALVVGDCFDVPTVDTSITEVQHRPCNEAHDAEVFHVGTHPAGADEAYPVVSGFDDFIQETCVPAFDAYTGRSFATDADLGIGYLHPTVTGWGSGDRGFTCYVDRIDRQKMSSSVRAAAPPAT